MKVLIVHTKYKFKGGEDNVVINEMNLLREKGIQVEMLEFSNEKLTFFKLLQMPFNIQSYLKTLRKLKEYKPDIVHVHNLHFGGSASVLYALKKNKTPFVLTLHNYRLSCPSATLFHKGNVFLDSMHQNFPWNAIKRGVFKNSGILTFWLSLSMQVHKWTGIYRSCNRVITLTQHAKKLLLDSKIGFTTGQVIVKPNFSYSPKSIASGTEEYFLFVGRLADEKGIELLLKVFSDSIHKIKIAGDGPFRNEVLKCSEQGSNIEFLGTLDKDKILSLLSNATALIFPSVWYEGMPLTIIESFGCGTPVIASNFGSMKDMVSNEHDGLYFKKGDEADLANKLEIWMKLPAEMRQIYRKNARNTYEKYYTPEKNYQQLLSIYKSVLNEKKEINGHNSGTILNIKPALAPSPADN